MDKKIVGWARMNDDGTLYADEVVHRFTIFATKKDALEVFSENTLLAKVRIEIDAEAE